MSSGNDYVVQVKHRKRALTRWVKACVVQKDCISQSHWVEQQKGRREERILSLYEPIAELRQNYAGLQGVIELRRVRTLKGQTTESVHYYITSLGCTDAERFQKIIRRHWAVENQLHWVKDVILGEDATKFHNYKTFKMNALYRNYACSCIKLNGWTSIKYALETLRTNPQLIIDLIRT